MTSRVLSWISLWTLSSLAMAQDTAFQAQVRPTEPLTPAQERDALRTPPGFEVSLFAAEPQIRKPMNLAFDTRGRLWVTVTQDYPSPSERPSDALMILEDTDGDGTADKVTEFADGLSIPIGVYPTDDGAIVWSIPNILRLRDTDGDDRADVREVLYGPLGEPRDTHGMQNAFRRGPDGWLYINHGFNNTSRLTGTDGSAIELQSGNVYRVRLDGTRVESFTHGQVNPFGSDWDQLGNLYTADCHSRPIYQLIPGAYYPSFGKPHDGLGFGPEIMRHSHGSTAISGLVIYQDTLWPEPFHNNAFVGNVMTSRVNRDQLVFEGSTPVAVEREDFIISEDPWFRPVDLRMGPDGALYIADFYNRIIGHYEVPLDHPGRDRTRGRIWRVRYTGAAQHAPIALHGGGLDAGLASLAAPLSARRDLALDWLEAHANSKTLDAARKLLSATHAPEPGRVGALWLLHRRDQLEESDILNLLEGAPPQFNHHLILALEARPSLTSAATEALVGALTSRRAHVIRAAARALARHPSAHTAPALLTAYQNAPTADSHRHHQLKIALRNTLALPGALTSLPVDAAAPSEWLLDIVAAIPTSEAASFLIHNGIATLEDADATARYFAHAARYVAPEDLPQLIALEERAPLPLNARLALFESAFNGWNRRGAPLPPSLMAWGRSVITQTLEALQPKSSGWTAHALAEDSAGPTPWFLQARDTLNVDHPAPFLCSLPPGGERLTGVLRSPTFPAPVSLSFSIAGHRGYPDQPAHDRNLVRVVHEETGDILAHRFPPRQDLALDTDIDLSAHHGESVYLELVDGDTGDAYAWLAVGRIRPEVLTLPAVSPMDRADYVERLSQWLPSLGDAPILDDVGALAADPSLSVAARAAAAAACLSISTNAGVGIIISEFTNPTASRAYQGRLADLLAQTPSDRGQRFLETQLAAAEAKLQQRIALAMARNASSAERLLQAMESGVASPYLLNDPELSQSLANQSLENGDARIADLTADLPPAIPSDAVVAQRLEAFKQGPRNVLAGRSVFDTHCRVCHRIGSEGGLVGPQLDGVASRGIARLAEDILDPNRNVDQAFRYLTITLRDGSAHAGLKRREEGAIAVFADLAGQEFSIPTADIASTQATRFSLMPANFATSIPSEDFVHLLEYLTQP